MALVAYDSNSGSENESDEQGDELTTSDIFSSKDHNSKVATEDITTSNDVPEILSNLPLTRTSPTKIVEGKLEDFIPKYRPTQIKKKKAQTVKITIPLLSEFKEDDDDDGQSQPKRQKSQSKGSGLLSILPPARGSPLSNKSFVPNVVKNQQQSTGKINSFVPNAVRKKSESTKQAVQQKITKSLKGESDVESDDDVEVPETFDDDIWQKVCGRHTKPKEIVQVQVVEPKTINIAPEPVKPYDGLDNAAFKELIGKTKRPVNIKLIDINEEEILPDKNLWLTKSLTDPDQAPKPVIENPVDPTRKKKHHITYLAEQAKANEQELQSQWSSSKYVRNQTRAKYGF